MIKIQCLLLKLVLIRKRSDCTDLGQYHHQSRHQTLTTLVVDNFSKTLNTEAFPFSFQSLNSVQPSSNWEVETLRLASHHVVPTVVRTGSCWLRSPTPYHYTTVPPPFQDSSHLRLHEYSIYTLHMTLWHAWIYSALSLIIIVYTGHLWLGSLTPNHYTMVGPQAIFDKYVIRFQHHILVKRILREWESTF